MKTALGEKYNKFVDLMHPVENYDCGTLYLLTALKICVRLSAKFITLDCTTKGFYANWFGWARIVKDKICDADCFRLHFDWLLHYHCEIWWRKNIFCFYVTVEDDFYVYFSIFFTDFNDRWFIDDGGDGLLLSHERSTLYRLLHPETLIVLSYSYCAGTKNKKKRICI